MRGIYPDYIGPTQRASHYPNWIDRLTENDVVINEEPGYTIPDPGGPSGERPYYDTPLSAQIKREDEEILAMIMAAIRIIQ